MISFGFLRNLVWLFLAQFDLFPSLPAAVMWIFLVILTCAFTFIYAFYLISPLTAAWIALKRLNSSRCKVYRNLPIMQSLNDRMMNEWGTPELPRGKKMNQKNEKAARINYMETYLDDLRVRYPGTQWMGQVWYRYDSYKEYQQAEAELITLQQETDELDQNLNQFMKSHRSYREYLRLKSELEQNEQEREDVEATYRREVEEKFAEGHVDICGVRIGTSFIARGAGIITEVLFTPMLRSLLMVFDCSHSPFDECTMTLDASDNIECFNNPMHFMLAAFACVSIIMLYPTAVVARGYLQLIDKDKTIYMQQNFVFIVRLPEQPP